MKRPNPSQGPTWLVLLTIISTATAIILLSRDTSALSGTDSRVAPIDRSDIQALPIVIRPGIGGLALVDQKHQTISIYQYQSNGIQGNLVFLAARCYKYDVQLQEYNSAEPQPGSIKALLEKASQADKTHKSPPPGPDTPQK